jgi:signal transduction histidine kinase
MSIDQIKHQILSQKIQVVQLDQQGCIVDSCDTFLPLKSLRGTDVFAHFPILTGLEDVVLNLHLQDPPFSMPLMDFEFAGRRYSLNLDFRALPQGGFAWVISDNEDIRHKIAEIQQDRNESSIFLDRIRIQERMLRDYNERLEAMNTRLDRFAYNVAHDLRSPLRAIQNLAEWIAEACEEKRFEELPEYLELLRKRSARMETLIGGILAYSRAGHSDLPKETVDVRQLLIDLMASEHPDAPCVLRLPDTLPRLKTQRPAITQVFSNLIGNAVKYAGRPGCAIEVSAEDLGEHVRFCVRDNGPGIDPKHHERIFEIFNMLDNSDVTQRSGIGLAIVKKLVEEAGCKVSVESQVGAGATFLFTWPKS